MLGKKRAQIANDLEVDRVTLNQMETRQAALQQDVERLRERQEVMKKIDLMKKAKPFVEYRIARSKVKKLKEARTRVERELTEMENQVKPLTDAPKAKKKYHKALEKCVVERKKVVDDKEKEVMRFKSNVISKADDKIKEVNDKMDAARKAESTRKEAIRSQKEKITRMKKLLETKPPEVELAYYNDKIVSYHNNTLHDTNANKFFRMRVIAKSET
jgi:structural maintenance of chromosomes protein 5